MGLGQGEIGVMVLVSYNPVVDHGVHDHLDCEHLHRARFAKGKRQFQTTRHTHQPPTTVLSSRDYYVMP